MDYIGSNKNDIETVGPGSAIRLLLSESWTKKLFHRGNQCHAMWFPVLQMHLGHRSHGRPKSLRDRLYRSRLRPQNGAHNRCNWMHNLQKMPFCKAGKQSWEQDHFLATENLHLKQFETFANHRFDEAPGPFVML